MKKILGYIAVLLVFSWMTTANASVLSGTITGASGDLTVSGFGTDPAPVVNPTISFFFDFAPGDAGGIVNVIDPIIAGALYNVDVEWTIPLLATTFNTSFDIVSLTNSAVGSAPVNTAVGAFLSSPNNPFIGNPLGTLVAFGNTLNLYKATVGGSASAPTLLLETREPEGQTTLLNFLQGYDGFLNQGGPIGSITAGYTNAHLEAYRVPEPATLLLLGSGLLGMFGFSKKRA